MQERQSAEKPPGGKAELSTKTCVECIELPIEGHGEGVADPQHEQTRNQH